METTNTTKITVETTVNAPVEKVWNYFTSADHVVKWNSPSEDWHTPRAQNDLRPGGKFNYRMEAKDGSFGFDFEGVYDQVKTNELTEYTMSDGRKVVNEFITNGNETRLVVTFDAENQNPVDFQQAGWQAIMDNFKKYTEAN
jgi:uncharacterized protein YndB with AHSA1/START domain